MMIAFTVAKETRDIQNHHKITENTFFSET